MFTIVAAGAFGMRLPAFAAHQEIWVYMGGSGFTYCEFHFSGTTYELGKPSCAVTGGTVTIDDFSDTYRAKVVVNDDPANGEDIMKLQNAVIKTTATVTDYPITIKALLHDPPLTSAGNVAYRTTADGKFPSPTVTNYVSITGKVSNPVGNSAQQLGTTKKHTILNPPANYTNITLSTSGNWSTTDPPYNQLSGDRTVLIDLKMKLSANKTIDFYNGAAGLVKIINTDQADPGDEEGLVCPANSTCVPTSEPTCCSKVMWILVIILILAVINLGILLRCCKRVLSAYKGGV
jgi:hypothetical protein